MKNGIKYDYKIYFSRNGTHNVMFFSKKEPTEKVVAEPAAAPKTPEVKKSDKPRSTGKSGGRGKPAPKTETNRFANSRPVKKGKGSFKKK